MSSLLCLEEFPALVWLLLMSAGLPLTSEGWGYVGDPVSCWRGTWGSPKVGIKIASCHSSKRLLGFVGHPDPSLGFASAVSGLSRGRLLSLQLSGPLQPFPWPWIAACSEPRSRHRSVSGTAHPPLLGVYQQEQPEPGAGSGGYRGRSSCAASEMHFVLDHPPLRGALAEPPPNLLICPSTEVPFGCPGWR